MTCWPQGWWNKQNVRVTRVIEQHARIIGSGDSNGDLTWRTKGKACFPNKGYYFPMLQMLGFEMTFRQTFSTINLEFLRRLSSSELVFERNNSLDAPWLKVGPVFCAHLLKDQSRRQHIFLQDVSFLWSESGVNTRKTCKLEARVDLRSTFLWIYFRQDKLKQINGSSLHTLLLLDQRLACFMISNWTEIGIFQSCSLVETSNWSILCHVNAGDK